jgi:fatty acid desaturase
MPIMDADPTVPRSATNADYAELRRKVVAAGLLKRTYAYYLYRGGMCFALLSLNMLLWVVLMVFLGWRGVGIFVGSQVIAGIYLGAIIAPNHKGMPVWAHGAKLSFLERQVLSSRNVTSHPVWDFLFGGLNYQIEHHLFPTMPRVHFKHAQAIIKPFCAAHGLPYEEVDPLTSYRMVYAAFRRVGRAAA